jgi:hypothetical protein
MAALGIGINERGFARVIAEVGGRFGEFHHAVSMGGYALALYQWEKIADGINAGLMRRPGRTRNAEGMPFLNDGSVFRKTAALLAE